MVRAATFQEVERTLDAHLTVGEGSFNRGPHTSHGCEMDHQIDRLFLEETMQQLMVPDVALVAYHASGCPRHGQQALDMLLLDSRRTKIIDIIPPRHPMLLGPQTRAELRPDTACPSCYQDMRHHYLSAFLSRHKPFDSIPKAWLNLLRKFSNATIAVISTTSASVGNYSR